MGVRERVQFMLTCPECGEVNWKYIGWRRRYNHPAEHVDLFKCLTCGTTYDTKCMHVEEIDYTNDFYEDVVEQCPECGREVHLMWDVQRDGYKAHCPYCGKVMMLCSQCMADHDYDCTCCDWNSETNTCKYNKEVRTDGTR